ncbi:unnamed protein product [Alopecurus aequalis]
MPPASAAHRRRGKRPIDGAHSTDSPTPHRRRLGPSHFLAVRPFSLRFALSTAPHRPRKRRLDGARHPAPSPRRLAVAPHPDPCPPRRRRRRRVVSPHYILALRPFLRYVLGTGASALFRRRKASVIDMGAFISRAKRLLRNNTDDGGFRDYKRPVEGLREVGDLSAYEVHVDMDNAAWRGTGDASDITMEEASSYWPKEDLYELFKPLTHEEENEVNGFLYGSGHSKDSVVHERSNIEITREKLGCLRPRGWLNDEVINLYLELLKERAEREPTRFLKCHFFNTFFYKKLACGKTGYDYQSVRRWTTRNKLGYELVDCDKIFIPIHRDLHWCLAVINMKEKTFHYLDSLGGMDYDAVRILARYIMDELKEKSNVDIDFSSWLEVPVSLPMQYNGWDCGMFMLKFIDFYSRGLRLSFSQEHMEYFRKRTAKEILRLKAE